MTKGTPFFFRKRSDFKNRYKRGKRTAYLFGILFLVSCNVVQDAASESFKYSFSEGFCSTGEKSFSTNAQMCTALQNNSYNNGCAQSQRQSYFQSKCPGAWTPTSAPFPLIDFLNWHKLKTVLFYGKALKVILRGHAWSSFPA